MRIPASVCDDAKVNAVRKVTRRAASEIATGFVGDLDESSSSLLKKVYVKLHALFLDDSRSEEDTAMLEQLERHASHMTSHMLMLQSGLSSKLVHQLVLALVLVWHLEAEVRSARARCTHTHMHALACANDCLLSADKWCLLCASVCHVCSPVTDRYSTHTYTCECSGLIPCKTPSISSLLS